MEGHRRQRVKSCSSTGKRHLAELANTTSVAIAAVDTFVDCVHQPGLVEWIKWPTIQSDVAIVVGKIRRHLRARTGNHIRQWFQTMVEKYMVALGIEHHHGVDLKYSISEFTDAIDRQICTSIMDSSLKEKYTNEAKCIKNAYHSVCIITNANSHRRFVEHLSDAELVKLSGCIGTFADAMPRIAQLFGFERVLSQETVSSIETEDLLYSDDECDRKSAWSIDTSRMSEAAPVQPAQSVQLAPTPRWYAQDAMHRGPPIPEPQPMLMRSRMVYSSPPPQRTATDGSWADVTRRQATPAPPRSLTPQAQLVHVPRPTAAALQRAATYRFLYDCPYELPVPTGITPRYYARMMNQIEAVPKARLCCFPMGHDTQCPRSHTYLEVMTYNPFFKVIPCIKPNHFHASTVEEDDQCPCLHVDTKLNVLDCLLAVEKELCPCGSTCPVQTCVKAHSYEEMCWFNPKYKTVACGNPHHSKSPAVVCGWYHARDPRPIRKETDEHDHIGIAKPLVHIDRTHRAHADALEALRFRANA